LNTDTIFNIGRTSLAWCKKQRRFVAAITLGLACSILPSVAFAQNNSTDPDPDVEKGAYLSLTLDQSVVAVGDPLTGTATVYEGDGDIDSDDTVAAALLASASPPMSSPSAAGGASPMSSPSPMSSQSAAGTVKFSFPTSAPGDFTIDGVTADVPDQTAAGHAIGGPITGDNDEYYYCGPEEAASHKNLQAATGQPAGTTYSWSMSGNATYCDTSNYGAAIASPTAALVTYRGVHPGSIKAGDVTATVQYTLNGKSVSSPGFPITVHAPATFALVKNGATGPTPLLPNAPHSYGFDGQQIQFQVLDGLGQPVVNGNWDEFWDDSKATGNQGGKPLEIGGPLNGQGISTDFFHVYDQNQPTNPAGDLLIGNLSHTYYVTDIPGTGGKVGCPVQTYTGVNYYTYKLTGNGF